MGVVSSVIWIDQKWTLMTRAWTHHACSTRNCSKDSIDEASHWDILLEKSKSVGIPSGVSCENMIQWVRKAEWSEADERRRGRGRGRGRR